MTAVGKTIIEVSKTAIVIDMHVYRQGVSPFSQ